MKAFLHKHYSIFLNGLKIGTTYRAEMFLWSFIDGVPLLYMLLLWHSVIPSGGVISGFTQNKIISYYLIGFIIRQMTGAHFEDYIIDEIKKGAFSTFLLKPISIKLFFFCHEIAWRVMTLFTSVLPITILVYLLDASFLPHISWTRAIYLFLLMSLAYSIETIFSLMVAAMGFVFENAKSFMHLRWILNMIFSGILIPFEFMPAPLRIISLFLPFRFRQYTPVQLVIREDVTTFFWQQLIYSLCWLAVLVLLLKLIWQKAIKSYTAVGN